MCEGREWLGTLSCIFPPPWQDFDSAILLLLLLLFCFGIIMPFTRQSSIGWVARDAFGAIDTFTYTHREGRKIQKTEFIHSFFSF